MKNDDPDVIAWAQDLREARQEVDTSSVFGRIDPSTKQPIPNWVGLMCSSENNETGRAEVTVEVRPVLRGRIEMNIRVETRGIGATRPHAKSVYVSPTPQALREFAHSLLATADEAEARAKANGPRLVT